MKTDFEFEENQSGISGVFFWIFAAVALFMFLGENALRGLEAHWAECSREMLITGHFLRPSVNWKICLDNSPFLCWVMASAMQFLGESEWVLRLPAALAGLMGLYGTVSLAQQLFDRKTAVLSCWLLLSSYGFLFWSRTASADMAGMAAGVWAVYWLNASEKKSSWEKYFLFYLAVFICILLKGIPGAAVLIVFLLPHVSVQKRWLQHLKKWNYLALFLGCCLGAGLLYFAFLLPSISPAGGDIFRHILYFLKKECAFRSFSFGDKENPFYSYLFSLGRLLGVWTPLFLLCTVAVFKEKKENDGRIRELFWGILAAVLLLTLLASHHWNNILFLAPFACIFMSAVFYREGEDKSISWMIAFLRWCVIFAGALALASPIMLPVFRMMFHQMPPLLTVLAVPAAGLGILTLAVLDQEPGNCVEYWTGIPCRLASMTVGMVVIAAAFFSVIEPALPGARSEKSFVKSLAPVLAGIPMKNIALYGSSSAEKFLFYLRWQESVTLLNCDQQKPEENIQKFIRRNAGEKVIFLCRSGKMQESLFRELAACGIDTANLKPVKKEAGSGEKWLAFAVTASGRKVSSQEQQNKNSLPQL